MKRFFEAVFLCAILSSMVLPLLVIFGPTHLVDASTELGTFSVSELHSDFNGDGYDDLAIGIPGETLGTAEGAGAVSVIYGSGSGLQSSSPADQLWHQNSPCVEDVAETGDRFGGFSLI